MGAALNMAPIEVHPLNQQHPKINVLAENMTRWIALTLLHPLEFSCKPTQYCEIRSLDELPYFCRILIQNYKEFIENLLEFL
jgi:hypothetical protein